MNIRCQKGSAQADNAAQLLFGVFALAAQPVYERMHRVIVSSHGADCVIAGRHHKVLSKGRDEGTFNDLVDEKGRRGDENSLPFTRRLYGEEELVVINVTCKIRSFEAKALQRFVPEIRRFRRMNERLGEYRSVLAAVLLQARNRKGRSHGGE